MRQTPFGVWNSEGWRKKRLPEKACNEADAFWRLERLPVGEVAGDLPEKACNEADAFWRLEPRFGSGSVSDGNTCNEADAFWRLEQR